MDVMNDMFKLGFSIKASSKRMPIPTCKLVRCIYMAVLDMIRTGLEAP